MIRFFDFIFSFFGLLLLSPIILLLVLIGLLDTGAPIFRQERVGKNKKPFFLLKFRSMHKDTQSVATHLANYSSVTKYGAFLRRSMPLLLSDSVVQSGLWANGLFISLLRPANRLKV